MAEMAEDLYRDGSGEPIVFLHGFTGSWHHWRPLLGPLADNGGPTNTMALPAGSPAIDAADPALAPAADQRGRPRDPRPDIGAFEFVIVVTTLA